MTVIKDGYHGDTNMMYIVGGETSILANRLCKVAQKRCIVEWQQLEMVRI